MQSEFYEFGGTVFRIDSEEHLLKTKFTAPFVCGARKEPDFVITVCYSDDEKMPRIITKPLPFGSVV